MHDVRWSYPAVEKTDKKLEKPKEPPKEFFDMVDAVAKFKPEKSKKKPPAERGLVVRENNPNWLRNI